MTRLLASAASLALLTGFAVATPAAAQSLGPVGSDAQCNLAFPNQTDDPAHCSLGGSGTSVSASIRLSPSVLMSAYAATDSAQEADSSAFLGYDFNITGGAAGDTVKIGITTKLTTDLTGDGSAFAQIVWVNSNIDDQRAVCDSSDPAATACVSNHVFDGTIFYDATVGDLQHLQIFISASGGLHGSGTATADPFIFALGISDPDAVYAIQTTGGVANALPGAGVPEPAAWALMLAGFGLSGAALRRRSRRLRLA